MGLESKCIVNDVSNEFGLLYDCYLAKVRNNSDVSVLRSPKKTFFPEKCINVIISWSLESGSGQVYRILLHFLSKIIVSTEIKF